MSRPCTPLAQSNPDHGQVLKDFLFFPIRAAMLDSRVSWLGLTSLQEERISACLAQCEGRLLDIGCGENQLVATYGQGVGVDAYPWPGIDVLCDTSRLPFADGTFDTISLLACLNHIPERAVVLKDARRVLAPQGRLLITMIDPVIGSVAHGVFKLLRSDPDCCGRGMLPGECSGLWPGEVERLMRSSGFRPMAHQRFLYGLNHLFIAEPA